MELSLDAGAVRQLTAAAELNRRLFLNCLDSVTEEDALRRPNNRVNNLTFVACHVLDARHFLSRFLGLELFNPFDALLGNVRSIEDVVSLPPLQDVQAEWIRVSTEVHACLSGLTTYELTRPSPERFPILDATFGGAIGFQLHHESYHIGQLALIRKFLGYGAMTYG